VTRITDNFRAITRPCSRETPNTLRCKRTPKDCASNPTSSTSGNCKYFKFLISNSHDAKAQKNGAHRSVYWVQKKKKQEDGSIKGEKWEGSSRYIGDWRDNCKEGFGI
jgi:hypothetical protein